LKILIGSSESYFFHFKEFTEQLTKMNIECKLVKEVYVSVLSRKFLSWFQKKRFYKKIIDEFKPDVVLVDQPANLAISAIDAKIPLLILLRGDYWREMNVLKDTLYKYPLNRQTLWIMNRVAQKCFQEATAILPISKHLEKIVNELYPNKPTMTFYPSIDTIHWHPKKGMKLDHPCIGLIQTANIWDKTKEMLILPRILEAMPNVNFYWAGDGVYKDQILPTLGKYKNFKWLGKLDYPDKVREFFTEMDVYALVSGLDMMPISLIEAQLMEKPVVASNVGGVSETMKDNETGFLVDCGDYKGWIEKLSILIDNEDKRNQMGAAGAKFVKENFSLEKSVKDFIKKFKEITKK